MLKRFFINIIRFFKQNYSKPVNSYPSHGSSNKPEFKPVWGIIIPHTKNSPGAYGYSPFGQKINEYEYAQHMNASLKLPQSTRDVGGVYGAAKRLNSIFKVNATLEPHKNAFNKKAKGFELLILKGDSLSEKYARLIAEAFKDKYPETRMRHDNGIKWIKKGDRGYHNLVNAKKHAEVAILSEAFFIDNPDEWIGPDEMAKFWKEVLV